MNSDRAFSVLMATANGTFSANMPTRKALGSTGGMSAKVSAVAAMRSSNFDLTSSIENAL